MLGGILDTAITEGAKAYRPGLHPAAARRRRWSQDEETIDDDFGQPGTINGSRKSASDSDSIRVGARDLVLVLRLFRQQSETTLENIRLRICMDRKKPRRGEGLASTARDIAVELQKLELVKGGPFPKAKSDYPRLRDKVIRITPAGRDLLRQFQTRLAEAYDSLFIRMFAAHRYLRDYARVLGDNCFSLRL